MQARVAAARARLDMFGPFVRKELLRGRALDAFHFWTGLVLPGLVLLLRARHAPDRYDYGMRYLADDLPADAHARLTRLAFTATPDALGDAVDEALAWATEL